MAKNRLRQPEPREALCRSRNLRGFSAARVCFVLQLAAALGGALIFCPPAAAQIEVYYNIVSVTSEQLNNAVRVKMEADGAISADISRWWSGGEEANYYLDWQLVSKQTTGVWSPDCYPKVRSIRFHLDNARPQVGSVVYVGKYPVSHVRLLMTPEKGGRFGLDVEVVLHKPMRLRLFKLANFGMWDAYLWDHHDPMWFEVVQSPDRRSLVITVMSDRLPELPQRRKLGDVPEKDRELSVSSGNGLLDIHARNVGLSDLLNAISRASGKRMMAADSASERLVTAELPCISPEEFAQRIADSYGLTLTSAPESLIFSDIVEQTAASQASVETTRVPVRNIKAALAADLLPNFLLDYVKVDEEGNALIVCGSKQLAEKIAADIAKIDQPPVAVSLEATLIESSSAADLARELGLRYVGRHFQASIESAPGELTYSKVGALASDFDARLSALVTDQKAKIRARSTVAVASGQTGEVFAGVEKYIKFQPKIYDPSQVVEPVSAGVGLSVTPWASSDTIIMNVAAEVKAVGEVDPITRLPVINTRTADGTFMIRPGETVTIGGLSQVQSEISIRKIPVLGDLPLVGSLFRKKTRVHTASELTVLLTPTIVESSGEDEFRGHPHAANTRQPLPKTRGER
jgi:protein transport protein HofQ/type IV pilus assembly protein PilQ